MIKIFCDSADLESIKKNSSNPLIKGWTTNPTLMYKSGITDYRQFAVEAVDFLKTERPDTCLSLEVFADDLNEMLSQAETINSWFSDYNYPIYIKIPIHNTMLLETSSVIKTLTNKGIKVNITAIFTKQQADYIHNFLDYNTPSIISFFAGRIYDTGRDALDQIIPFVKELQKNINTTEVLWASPRQIYDYILAQKAGCDIITMTPEILNKLSLMNYSLDNYTLDTVKMFYNDGIKAGFKI